MTFVSLHNYLIGLKPLLAALLLLLMTAFGTVAVFAAPEDWSQASYPIAAPKLVAQPVNLTHTARAPPTTITNVMATGTAFARTGNLRAFDGVEASEATHALLHSSIAPNRTLSQIDEFIDVRTAAVGIFLRTIELGQETWENRVPGQLE